MTKAERERLDAIHRMPCIACWLLERLGNCGRVEAHHIVDNGYRRLSGGHMSTIPLGAWHHRGEPKAGVLVKDMEEIYGPSLALRKRAFIARFGSERDLLIKVNAMWEPA